MNGGASPFRFLELHKRTPDLMGPERAEVFHRLPDILQREAWASLAAWADDRSMADFEWWCRDV